MPPAQPLEASMLESGKMVGFVLTRDYEKARAFYEGKLGCEFASLDQYALVMRVGGHQIRISKAPSLSPLQSTVLGWEARDIEAVAATGWSGSKTLMATFSRSASIAPPRTS